MSFEPQILVAGSGLVRAECPVTTLDFRDSLKRAEDVDLESLSSIPDSCSVSISASVWYRLAESLGKFCVVRAGAFGDFILLRAMFGNGLFFLIRSSFLYTGHVGESAVCSPLQATHFGVAMGAGDGPSDASLRGQTSYL